MNNSVNKSSETLDRERRKFRGKNRRPTYFIIKASSIESFFLKDL